MRMQTFYLIDIQLDKKNKINYATFKQRYMLMAWDKVPEVEIPNIEWEELDRRDMEISQNAKDIQVLKL